MNFVIRTPPLKSKMKTRREDAKREDEMRREIDPLHKMKFTMKNGAVTGNLNDLSLSLSELTASGAACNFLPKGYNLNDISGAP
jgi:hypothetical protein